MPKTPSDRQPEPMAREVDRLLAQLATFGSPPARDPESHGGAPTPRPVARVRSAAPSMSSGQAAAPSIAGPTLRELVSLWARVLLGTALGVLMTQWPYPNGCGAPLLGYLGGVLTVLLAGGWIAFESWKLRSGITHIAALILFFWGIVLAGEQLLPRIGYAVDQARWLCPTGIIVDESSRAERGMMTTRTSLLRWTSSRPPV